MACHDNGITPKGVEEICGGGGGGGGSG